MHTRANIIDHSFTIPLCPCITVETKRTNWGEISIKYVPLYHEKKKGGEKVSIYSCIEKFSCSGLKKESLNGFSFSLLDIDFKKNISLLLNPNGMVLLQGLRRKKYHAIPYCAITFESFISRDINLILLMQINFYKCESDICLQR